ncbi:MAG TPA: ANTAR domain-containing protein [Streptomyces sp.]|jgi:hypothetical protein|nr:ANTAR domain-containing protein [Streptomyces sp.]
MTSETSDTLDQAVARSSGLGLDTLLRDLTDRAVEAVPGADACSITVRRGDRLLTLAGSDGLANGLDQRQYENDSGPCVAAATTGAEQYSPDLRAETRWSTYTEYALSAGVRCVLALPLDVEGGREEAGGAGAAVNFYSVRPGALGAGRERARTFAARATDAVNVALRVERRRASASDVRTALLSRSVIDQAIGILMAREGVDARCAMDRLRRVSQDRNVKLRDLCEQLVARTTGARARPGHQ